MPSKKSADPLTVAMVAGEASGDNLGASLTRAILELEPNVQFVGIGGSAMIAEGFPTFTDIEQLSVNGFVDPILRLPQLIKLLTSVRDEIVASGADVFVGIDSNFFNLLLAGMLRKRGVKTIQYVSPTVWAWRKGRIKKIKRNVDLMMTLYPFENAIYEEHGVPVVFVGHPKAAEIQADAGPDGKAQIRNHFGISEGPVVALLPGSRGSEVALTGRDFLSAAQLLENDVKLFLIPAANEKRLDQLKLLLEEFDGLNEKVRLVLGQSREVMTAADLVLVNSGTATLEAMLLRKPMVMSYRLGKITYAIVSKLVDSEYFALPNILAGRRLVPEFIQDAAEPNAIADAVRELLQLDETNKVELMRFYDEIHRDLVKDAAVAATAVLSLGAQNNDKAN